MDFDNERYHSESEFYYLGEDFAHFRPFHSNPVEKKMKNFICRPRSIRTGKNCARGLDYGQRSVQFSPIQTSRAVNNIYVWNGNF